MRMVAILKPVIRSPEKFLIFAVIYYVLFTKIAERKA